MLRRDTRSSRYNPLLLLLAAATALIVGVAGLAGTARAADIWALDKTASVITFTYDHFGLSRQSGRFRDFDARLEFSPTEPDRGAVDVTIRASQLSTGVQALDSLLRSPDFFDAARHPAITFKSTAVRPTGERTGDIDGELTMLGVTRPVTLKARWNYTGEYPLSQINSSYMGKWVSGFSARTVIERSQWGMRRGIPLLSDEVEIAIEVEFLKVE